MIRIQLLKTLSAVSGQLKLDIDVSIKKGELVALYGPSGSGKTSILRMIAGLMKPDGGKIEISGRTWYNANERVAWRTQERNFGIVFQDYGLFPNMTVRQNIAFALKDGGCGEVDEMIRLMELSNLEDMKPDALSGGQRQRVAFARAIIRKPALLLLDEPFAALDTSLRMRMQDLMLETHRRFQLTTILVSHDLLEVARLADRVFLLENGTIIKNGTPKDVIPIEQIENMLLTISRKYRD